ncbi:MAG: thioredoxin domain-containing protein, partial [Verrucomicrobia bacterium]|nr:thioredoxin domain-containing protein [Verrucomicrobiota bacterium]
MALAQKSASSPEQTEAPAPSRSTGQSFTNRLINEKSPYLQQHAHNPVNWYPWGEEAFASARKENKPIFLSVGYSTCHWCHVMEHESFESTQVARILNDDFVCIKVDREERPDVDRVYMTFVQAMTGSGGWPMSVWLTPDLKPFFGGTYYPPEQLTAVSGQIAAAWRTNRDKLVASSQSITRQLQQFARASAAATNVTLEASSLDKAYEQIKATYDPTDGGFGGAPKFPRPVVLNFVLRYYARTGNRDALEMSLFTLRKMANGGIHDHIGGGFHRYSTDARWHVPHFEKMLYDQAQLVCSYLDAYQITHDRLYADVARDILAYVQRDMTGDRGQFNSAEDADSPLPKKPSARAEGAFYVWTQTEIIKTLGEESAEAFNYYFGVKKGGNVDHDPRGEFENK